MAVFIYMIKLLLIIFVSMHMLSLIIFIVYICNPVFFEVLMVRINRLTSDEIPVFMVKSLRIDFFKPSFPTGGNIQF